MKKLTGILLSVIILVCTSVLVQAEDKDYDVQVHSPYQVYYYDDAHEPGYNWFLLRVATPDLEKYEYVEYDFIVNKDILRYDTISYTGMAGFIRDVKQTDVGCKYIISKDADINVGIADIITMRFDILSIGDINFDVTATGYYPDGTQKQLNIDLEKPYDKVVDISEVEFLDKEKYDYAADYISQYALVDHGTTAGELVSESGAKTAVVINADGEVFETDASVPNGAYIATMYDGFVVDKIQLCVIADVNCDGKSTAADARLALRCAAKLEELSDIQKLAADVNGVNGITAADARLIIRKAAKLDVPDIPGKEEPSTEIDKFTVSAVLKSEYVNKQEECKEYFEDCEYIKGIIVFSTTDCEVGLEFSLTGTGAENFDATVEFIKNSGFFSAVYYHKV